MDTDLGPESTPRPNPHNRSNNSPVSETGDLEEAGHAAGGGGEDVPDDGTLLHLKRSRMWAGALVVSVLFLIVVPGLVLGVMTRQMPWGIALSGTIATVIGIFAGLYYHLNKQD